VAAVPGDREHERGSGARPGDGDVGHVGRGCRGQGQMGFLVCGWVSLRAGDGGG
jgi:hypothetical protein